MNESIGPKVPKPRQESPWARLTDVAEVQDLLDDVDDLVLLVASNGQVLYANLPCRRRFKWSDSELPRASFYQFVDSHSVAPCREAVALAWVGVAPPEIPLTLAVRDGASIRVTARIRRQLHDGLAPRLRVILRDAGSPSEAPESLDAGEAALRSIFINSQIGILLTRPDGTILAANPACYTLFGYTEDELRTLGRAAVVDTTDPRLGAALAERTRTGRFAGEIRLRRADGSVFPGELISTMFRGADGDERTSMLIRDLTEDVRVRERRAALLRVARRLAARADASAVFDALVDEAITIFEVDVGAVWVWDEKAQLLTPRRQRLPSGFDYPSLRIGEGTAGRAARDRAPLAVNDDAGNADAVPEVAAAGIRGALAAPMLHEGRLLGVLWAGTVGRPGKFSDTDLEVAELLATLGAAVLIGLERSQLSGVLLAARTAEHEINNALALAHGFAELLADAPHLPADLRHLASEIVDGTGQAAERLQALSQLESIEIVSWGPKLDPTIRLDRHDPR